MRIPQYPCNVKRGIAHRTTTGTEYKSFYNISPNKDTRNLNILAYADK